MKIIYQSDINFSPDTQIITVLSDHAKVCIKDINYDVENGTIKILMLRLELKNIKKSIFGEYKPIYGSMRVLSLLTIKEVETMEKRVDQVLIEKCKSASGDRGMRQTTCSFMYSVSIGLHV